MNKKLLLAAGIATGLATAAALIVAAGVITYRIIEDDDPYHYHLAYKGI